MSDAKLWIDEVGCTAAITGTNVSYTMPLWVLDVMRDIIVTETEKKVEVTHRDFDIQQELLDKYKAENAKLRELVSGLEYCVQGLVCDCCPLYDPSGTNHRRCESLERELGIEVDESE